MALSDNIRPKIDLNAIVPVSDDEWNDIGLAPEYFAQALVERTGRVIFTEDDFYRIIFDDAWMKWDLPHVSLDRFVALVNDRLVAKAAERLVAIYNPGLKNVGALNQGESA